MNRAKPATRGAFSRSIVARTAGLASLMALAVAAVLLIAVHRIVALSIEQNVAETVAADLAGLADIFASGGRAELIRRIDDRQDWLALGGTRAWYGLREQGRPIAGSDVVWPALSAAGSQAKPVVVDGHPAYAQATLLGPSTELLVARDFSRQQSLLDRLLLSFLAAGAGVVSLTFLAARSGARRLQDRVEAINDGYREGGESAMQALRDDRRQDELGELARHSGIALGRLERVLSEQREVSNHIAHELRTPLMHLDNRLRTLRRQQPDAVAEDLVDQARRDIRTITGMLDSLLDMAASDARRGSAQGLVEVKLSDLAAELAELYAASMEEAGLRFEVAIEPGVVMSGEPMQLRRLISNMLDNANRYVPAGGSVKLEIGAGPVIAVSDDGPGIAADARELIFEPFRKGPSDDGRAVTGHGLGLALARAIAARHGLRLKLAPSQSGCRFVASPEITP